MEKITISASGIEAHLKEQEEYFYSDNNQIEAEKVASSNQNEMPLNDLSSEEIIRYRLVLEDTYRNPAHDRWHGDDMPQKFREGEHTFAEMEAAIVRFMDRVEKERDAETEIRAFTKSQESLPEYQDYLEKQKKLTQNLSNLALKEEVSLSWKAYVKACEALPEHKALMASKERQYLFAPLKAWGEEKSIIQSYPGILHLLLKKMVKISHAQDQDHSYSPEQMVTFKHNMSWLFVPAIEGDEWTHPICLKTLWREGWREEEIIRFMMSEKVKYILCHNQHIIQYQAIDGTLSQPIVRVFEKKI